MTKFYLFDIVRFFHASAPAVDGGSFMLIQFFVVLFDHERMHMHQNSTE